MLPGSLKVRKFGPGNRGKHVWTEEIENGHRTIYVRCTGCREIYKLTNKVGSMSCGLKIGSDRFVSPCIVCPHCETHTAIRLLGYKKCGISDVFDRD